METHIGFHKTKSFWHRTGYVSIHFMDVRGQSGGIWVLKQNGTNIVTVHWKTLSNVFNDIIHPSEQKGDDFNHSRVVTLLNVIDKCNLVEVDIIGRKFTRNMPCSTNQMVYHEMDKVMGYVTWHMTFPDAYVEVLCKFHSTITTSFSLVVAFSSKTICHVLLGLRQLGSLT
ncbi:unnamed protein product [Vicia faba]|uniref:Uncharacterized protein n=1 Tax=Vicia faba TaxID=3906 RepID=A0AAV0ZLL7_VICFA|nr:unnamed protein product [Vicia faba]